jgi:hypothetical protein
VVGRVLIELIAAECAQRGESAQRLAMEHSLENLAKFLEFRKLRLTRTSSCF